LTGALDVVLQRSSAGILLIGRDGDRFRERFLERHPEAGGRIHATGVLSPGAVGACLRACDVMIQPYPDGISARRTSALALMAHRLPIVTNSGWLTEDFWSHDGAVRLTPMPDGHGVGEAAVALLFDSSERQSLADKALDMYARMFDVRHGIAAIEAAS
jgi:glycosyltransferase involved in cell wall biosynthesis